MPTYKGTFTDKNGTRNIEILNDFEDFSVMIDGFQFSGYDLDGLALVDESSEEKALDHFDLRKISIHYSDPSTEQSRSYALELYNYQLKLQIPQIIIEVSTKKEFEIMMDFQLELRERFEEAIISFQTNGEHFEAKSSLLEMVLDDLQYQFKGRYRFKNCYGCLYGDYSVYGQGFMGSILCFKNQKEAYVSTQNKDEYMQLEMHDSQQQELYCCDEYEIRDKSVGCRGTVI
ncbi:DUF6304 family protein [Empedobacter sedimenti]|uniref:DUF6304 family protein n=1 Tax=Empedobacter sedimenti TaxID=3042610 RepID=UPI0024A6FCFA|nr:DUF6304 family protein [Empedobacter sedimenti]